MSRILLWDLVIALASSAAFVIVQTIGTAMYAAMGDSLAADLQEICPAANPTTVSRITIQALGRVDRGVDVVTFLTLGGLAGLAWLRLGVDYWRETFPLSSAEETQAKGSGAATTPDDAEAAGPKSPPWPFREREEGDA